jgi:hypothetical protein
MVFSSVSIAPYGDAVSEAEGRAGWGRDMPALSYAETLNHLPKNQLIWRLSLRLSEMFLQIKTV